MRLVAFLCLLAIATPHAQAQQKLYLSTLDWPPYTSQTLQDGGYASAVVRAAFAAVDIDIEVRYYPWARALSLAQQGKVDGLFPEYFAPEQRPDFLFSDPFPGGPAGLLKLRERHLSTQREESGLPPLSELRGLKIGLVRGYLNHPGLDSAPGLHREFARDDQQNLSKLLAGRVDLIFMDYLVAEFLIGRYFPEHRDEIDLLSPPLLQPTLHLALPRKRADAESTLKAFNRGLQIIRDNGELQRLRQHHGL
ncbi:ABC transporter substrate-binding protein [Aquipseudomonas alcaligenes]|uniref:Amino acid ABC transporter substrate-binding protein, PAAT family n=1 Tax=Aquipseudomonas alcaligenes TaxID=43263 RepID=A0A1N6VUP1_AQUAC|nr:transporter substrate-binding domain-containing protein [Pseudomonas alcaligenes]SIQ81587.1 amino acid ABC transporter substrate-binding protein, PAAT family [Pseudomonas alcaligenes]